LLSKEQWRLRLSAVSRCGVLRISAQMDSSSESDVEHHLVTNDHAIDYCGLRLKTGSKYMYVSWLN